MQWTGKPGIDSTSDVVSTRLQLPETLIFQALYR